MIHRIEHALVMDTDDIPGRGGYAVVGLSDGVTQAERVFVAENFGISDYLHDPRNDRVFYSFFRVPNGRRALVRRFMSGRRRNDTQNRVFVHTLFLDDATFDALHGLPWLLAESKFGASGMPLTLDYGPLLNDPAFPALEWQPDPEILGGIVQRFKSRLDRLVKHLPGVEPAHAVVAVIAALKRGRASLPHGPAYEQLTLLAWSMLPPRDRAELAWTQHDSRNTSIAFDLANVTDGATVDFTASADADTTARRIVAMNTTSDATHAEFHRRAGRWNLRVRGDNVRAWFAWRDALEAVGENLREPEHVILAKLQTLAGTVRPGERDPWVDGEEMLQLLWPNIERAIEAGDPAPIVVDRWASLLHRSGLGKWIFREPPEREWLLRVSQRIGADPLIRFFTFGAEEGERGAPVRGAVATWLIEQRPAVATDVLARFATHLAADRSGLVEPLVRRVIEAGDGLERLAAVTPRKASMGNLVLLASLVALQQRHSGTKAYVMDTLLPHLELSDETRQHVNESVADSVGLLLRDEPAAFLRFAQLGSQHQARLLEQVVAWLEAERGRTLPLAREIVTRTAAGEFPSGPSTGPLVFALARAQEPAATWGELLVRMATSIDARGEAGAGARFESHVNALSDSDVDREGLLALLVRQMAQPSIKAVHARCTRALIAFTEPAWSASSPDLVKVVRAAIQRSADVAPWDTLVARLAAVYTRHRDEVGAMLLTFWNRIDPREVPNVSQSAIAAVRNLEGENRLAFAKNWTNALGKLPTGPRSNELIAAVQALQRGESRKLRLEVNWRALKLGEGTPETLNEHDDDLWQDDARTYSDQIELALELYAGGRHATALQRVTSLIDLLASSRVLPTVKLAAETRLPIELASLTAGEWNQLVRLAPEKLFSRGSLLMSVTRQLGASDARDAAAEFEKTCQRARHRDALDGIAAGRIDNASVLRRMINGIRRVSARVRL